MAGETLLSVRDLAVEIVGRNGVGSPVNGVSYDLGVGETLGVVGESGSGKSLHLLAMLGLLPKAARVTSGRVTFLGQDLLKLRPRQVQDILGRYIGFIFQDPMTSLNPVMTIGRQIGEVLNRHLKFDRRGLYARTVELLDLVGIRNPEVRVSQFPHQLSGGMRQRVMIAMALACEPKLLIADEPTTALDVTVQAQVIDLVRSLTKRSGTSVIWVTHDMGVVAGLADTVQVMYAGQIVERGPVRSIFHNPRNAYTWSLLRSLPQSDQDREQPLYQIAGNPPNIFSLPAGDPFASRNPFATDRCFVERPPLREVGDIPGHQVACWYDLGMELARQEQVR